MCFINSRKKNQNIREIIGLSFLPDNEFSFIFMSPAIYENESYIIKFIKSSINEDNKKVFLCYQTEQPDKSKCFYYDINLDTMSEIFLKKQYVIQNIFQ